MISEATKLSVICPGNNAAECGCQNGFAVCIHWSTKFFRVPHPATRLYRHRVTPAQFGHWRLRERNALEYGTALGESSASNLSADNSDDMRGVRSARHCPANAISRIGAFLIKYRTVLLQTRWPHIPKLPEFAGETFCLIRIFSFVNCHLWIRAEQARPNCFTVKNARGGN
jgi:hypothetical protein